MDEDDWEKFDKSWFVAQLIFLAVGVFVVVYSIWQAISRCLGA